MALTTWITLIIWGCWAVYQDVNNGGFEFEQEEKERR